jgi:hypothetical protein
MVKFVWLEAAGGGRVPVNPDQVLYVRNIEGSARVVFGAFPGGFHELVLAGDGEEIIDALERGAGPVAVASAQSKPRRKTG